MTRTAALPLPARTEVAVVGAGPTGLALAVTLAEAGIDFVLLDRQAEGANTSRTAVVHARTLEVLDELDRSGALTADLVGRALATGNLDGYEARRRPVARRVVALTGRMTRVATTRNPALLAVRNTLLPLLARIPALRDRLATELAELDHR
ncbi:FAD-dependent oxidoreductase [Streptomyces sp. NBC_01233]|uniref:FAD-dependent oxidoreductase n=1 Tax=Streptomyces sp. NBC_01233 TaxID=2903787 RepID=UPI002E156063|nr:FAD-dependent monooxygenase [Streptomyces sp. NBC_01233]